MASKWIGILALTCLVVSGPIEASNEDERGKRLLIMDAELSGDLTDTTRAGEWPHRVAELTAALRQRVADEGLYTVVDNTPATDLLDRLKLRQNIHECGPCIKEVAERLGAERVLTAWVFRMSNLVLALHTVIWDPATGAVVMSRTLQFRGDNDFSWSRATDYFIHEVEGMQKPPQM